VKITKEVKQLAKRMGQSSGGYIVGRDTKGQAWVCMWGSVADEGLQARVEGRIETKVSIVEYGHRDSGFGSRKVDRGGLCVYGYGVKGLAGVVALAPVGSEVRFEVILSNNNDHHKEAGLEHDELRCSVYSKAGKVVAENIGLAEEVIPGASTARAWRPDGSMFWRYTDLSMMAAA